MTTTEYGSWASPISSILATESTVGFSDLQVDKGSGGGCYWSELRCDEDGRNVVCHGKEGGKPADWTPAGFSARTTVHEYGGGAFIVQGGVVYFSNFADQRMYAQISPTEPPQPITPENDKLRYANAFFSAKLNRIYCVREDHTKGGPVHVQNTVVVIDPATKSQAIIAEGCDFYSQPVVSEDGKKIAYVQWNHPNMPWDSTEIWVAELSPSGDCIVKDSAQKVAGGADNSVMQPQWTHDNELLYIGDQTDWWNLYHVKESGEHENLHPVLQEIAGPAWEFASHGYCCHPDNNGKIVTSFGGVLGIVDISTKEYRSLDTGYEQHSSVQFGGDGKIYCKGSSPSKFSAVLCVVPDSGKVTVLRAAKEMPIDAGYLSIASEISWPTGTDEVSHGFFYHPQNKDFVGPTTSKPPLLVRIHGGPTAQCFSALNLEIQYFTSRGFAVLDVNYRGSTGYGKAYRERQRGEWGIVDVEDCCSGALYLAKKGDVDAKRLCIDGGSAGGYTTLACLAFKDVFHAGVSHYGVGDVEILMQDTHKFESRYIGNLIAPYNEENTPLIHARSPIKHMDKLTVPLALFQGDDDKIVPPNQAEMMFEAVKAKGLPCAFVLFKGEQHGFRKAENIQKALDGEFYFYSQIFGFEPAEKPYILEIVNL